MTMATNNDKDPEGFYCFRLKKSADSKLADVLLIPCVYNCDLKRLRTELWETFGVPRDRRIFYIDDDGDSVPIDSECELHEALKLAKNAFMAKTAIPLIVGPSRHPQLGCSDDERSSETNEICCLNKELRSINDNPTLSLTEKISGSGSESNLEFDKQKHPIRKISSNQKTLDVKQCDRSNEEQTESENVEIPRELNASLQCQLDTVPPPWFTEYMEAMKKDMVSTIIHEVVKNVTEVLNKRLDSLAHPPLKELGQSRSQSYSSLSKRHPRCSFDSNEKNQKRMRSQDEEQSSDASIERVDEPQNVNTVKDSQIKKDMISTISQEVVKEMTELLNEIPLDPLASVPSKKSQSRSQSHVPSSKRFLRHFDSQSSEKNQRKTKLQDGKQSSDDASIKRAYKLRKASISKDMRQLEKELDLIEGAIYAITLKEEKKKKYQRLAQVSTDNLNSDIGKEQSTQSNNNTWNFPEEIPRKILSPQVDPMSYDETPEMFDELRMSCSVTGNQILDEGRRRDAWHCNNSDIDKTFWSGDQEEDDDAFEIIQMPASEKKSELSCPEELAAEQRRHDSNRDSPSFELLSDPPSPTCFIHFNEEHFSANEGNAEQQSLPVVGSNPPTNSIYVVDIHGKIYNEHQLTDLNEHVSIELEKRSGGAYSFVTETLPVQGNCCSKSLRSEQRSSEWKNPRDNVCDTCDSASSTYDDVRNSHTSYLTVWTHCDSKTQCSCQSQTDSSDFTQSFHSHTTSVTDTTDIYTEAYGKYDEQVPTTAKDVREAATTTARATATTTTPKNDHDVCVNGSCMEKTNERHYNGANNYPKCFCGSHSNTPRGTSVDSPYQSCRASGSSDRASSNVESRKSSVGDQTSGSTANPVHILPETLVTAATHVGSYAFDTACEMLDKIRAHTREDSAKRRGGVKCDDKKRFSVGLSLF